MDQADITIRVDASVAIGTGHAVRCRTLAHALRLRGGKVKFVTRAQAGHAGALLAEEGFDVSLLPGAATKGVVEDERQTIAAMGKAGCDWLIVDHYGLDRAWERKLRPHARNLLVLEDLPDRPHDCDLLLDQNYSEAGEARYRDRVPTECRLLLGPTYALLHPDYRKFREATPSRRADIERVLVFMGGTDSDNLTGVALSALGARRFAHLEVDVVIGANHPRKDILLQAALDRPNTRVHGPRPHLADLMAAADLSIGAGGSTTWERMCLGLPSIVISVAENQVPGCQALSRAGLIDYLGPSTDVDAEKLAVALDKAISVPEDHRESGRRGRLCVDGRGADRVAEAIIPTIADNLALRRAEKSDVYTYFSWANDPVVRASAIDTRAISLDTHLKWFDERLADPGSRLFVLEASGLPVGQVRFQRRGPEALISYSLDPLVRNRGWAKQLLKLGIEAMNQAGPCPLKALVKPENVASASTFMRLGFAELPQSNGLRHFELRPRGIHLPASDTRVRT